MTTTLEQANAALKAAVHERLKGTPKDDPKMVGYSPLTEPRQVVASTEETQNDESDVPCIEHLLQRQRGDSLLKSDAHPTSQAFYDLCDRLKDMHRLKSTDYGCPSGTDPLANIRNGARFVGIPAWKGAMVRLSDKVTRLATFNATGSLTFEGVEDNLIDLASYALLSLLLYREEHGGPAA
jgi:hypothetical protein